MTNSKGFTLIELIMIIILLGILSATAVVLVGNVLEQQKFDETVKEMNELKMANLGNPELVQGGMRTSFGFVGDVGGLPAGDSLLPLLVQGALPNWVTTAAYHAATYPAEPIMPGLGTGAGWKGPYIDSKMDDSGTYLATLDGWGNPYAYQTATGQVTSTGGGAGSIVIPEISVASLVTGGVTGTVRGNQGNPVEGAIVRIYYPNGSGSHTTLQTTTAADGTYSFANIPIGRRTLRVISGTSPNWVIMNDTVVVDGNQTVTKNITIADMVAPAAPAWADVAGNCTVNGAYPVKTNQINLSWSASTSPDVASYKIYRGTVPGGEALYKTGITGTSYADTPVSANTTYYYRMSAVDTAGNESAIIANPTGGNPAGSRIAGPIYKRAASTWRNDMGGPVGNETLRIPTTNSGISNITLNIGYPITVAWTPVATTSTIRRIRIGGNTVYGDTGCPGGGGNGVSVYLSSAYTYNCNNNQNIDIAFCDDLTGVTSMTAYMGIYPGGPFDGQLTGVPTATWP